MSRSSVCVRRAPLCTCQRGAPPLAPLTPQTSVPPSAAAAALAEARASFIDVRAPAEYTVAHARGFQNVPYAQLGAHTPAQDVYVMDDFGYYAEKAARELEAKGATVHVVDGGLFAWAYAGGMLEGQVRLAAALRRVTFGRTHRWHSSRSACTLRALSSHRSSPSRLARKPVLMHVVAQQRVFCLMLVRWIRALWTLISRS